MDESPSEVMNFCNGIAVKEEETDNSAAELLCKLINEEKSRENSSGLEALPWEKKVKILDSGQRLFVSHLDLKKHSETCETPVFSMEHLFPSPAKERDLHYKIPSFIQYKPFIRRNASQKEIAFDRECKKLEIAWTNRGLPVDRESLCSAASKDAFDLRGLSESLPSTSASEKKPSVIDFRRMLQQSPRSYSSQMIHNIERFETARIRSFSACNARERRKLYADESSPCNFRERRLYAAESLPASETIPAVSNSLKESVIKDAMMRRSLMRAQRWSRWKRIYSQIPPSELEKESATDEQKEASEERRNSDVEKALQYWARLGSEFAEMSPDDKPEEKREQRRNIDVENNQLSVGLGPLSKLHQDVGQCSNWEPGRNWITDFHFPAVRVPLNSPNKKEVNTDKNDPFLSMEKVLAEIRQSSVRLMREQSKLRTLNSLRGELSGDMDGSESEKPSSKQAFRTSIQNLLNSGKEADNLCLRHLEKGKKISDMKESVKSFRSFQSHFSLGSIKSDKVVPD